MTMVASLIALQSETPWRAPLCPAHRWEVLRAVLAASAPLIAPLP